MVTGKVTVGRHILVQIRQKLLSTRSVTPVAHQIADDSKERVHLDTSSRHLGVSRVANKLGSRAGSLYVGEDGIACCTQREGEESSAHIRGDSSNNDLLLAGGFNGSTELRIIPSTKSVSTLLFNGIRFTYLTSPWRRIKGALGYISIISFGRG
jgi:hypothetical protein